MHTNLVEDWLIISDSHIPFHNKVLHDKVLRFIKEVKPYGLAIIGDFIDMQSLSRFSEGSLKDLRDVSMAKDYAAGAAELDRFDQALPKGAKKVYIMGNHEDRFTSFMARMDNDKLQLQSPAEGLRLRERGYRVIDDWENGYYVLGSSLELIHGVSTGVNAAKIHLDRFQGSVISGHAHVIQHYCTNKRGSWIIGGLFNARSKAGYSWASRATKERWSNGFAYAIINGHGYHHVHLIHAFNDRFVFGPKLW